MEFNGATRENLDRSVEMQASASETKRKGGKSRLLSDDILLVNSKGWLGETEDPKVDNL